MIYTKNAKTLWILFLALYDGQKLVENLGPVMMQENGQAEKKYVSSLKNLPND